MVAAMLQGKERERCDPEHDGGTGNGREAAAIGGGSGYTRAEVTFNVSRHAAQGTVEPRLASSSLLIWRQFPGNLPSKN